MEIRKNIYSAIDKEKSFGLGKWVEEPDIVIAEYKNYKYEIKRICVCITDPYSKKFQMFGGHLCGYIYLPESNKYYDKQYDDIPITCHWGLTFSKMINNEWVIGFDCAHYGDVVPSIYKLMHTGEYYRNIEFCKEQCMNIIDQLVDIGEKQDD